MLRWPVLVLAGLGGCATSDPSGPIVHPSMPPDTRAPMPLTLRVMGEGTEMHPVRVDATLWEVHEALTRASARRETPSDAEAAGLEILVFDEQTVDGLIRAVRSIASLELTWMGVPVRWHRAASGPGCELRVRSWPIITELGPRAVVEYRLLASDMDEVHDELLLVPGEALAFATGAPGWPAPVDTGVPDSSAAACAMGWEGSPEAAPVGLILLIPRFDGRR
jgi:hypothetical protein